MPIEATLTPVEFKLERSDPTSKTWVRIAPATYEDEIERGELLKERDFVEHAQYGLVSKANVNLKALQALEIWLTYRGCNIILVGKDFEGEDYSAEPFKDITPRNEADRAKFYTALGSLPPSVVREWRGKLTTVNPDWLYPF